MAASGVAVGIAKHIGSTMVDSLGSTAYALNYNSQDFLVYSVPLCTDIFMRIGLPRLRNSFVRLASVAVGTAALLFTEQPYFPSGFLGTADPADIPAGLLGIAAYLGMSLWLDRYFAKTNHLL